MKAKRFISILLAALTLVAVFAACGGKEDSGSPSASTPESSLAESSGAPEDSAKGSSDTGLI